MKTKLILLFLLTSVSGFSQIYQLNKNMLLQTTSASNDWRLYNNTITNDSTSNLSENQYFEKVGEFGDNVFLKLATKKGESNENKTVYSVSKTKIKEDFSESKGRWTFGLLTLPIKVRFEGGSEENNSKRYFDFEGGFNLGLSIGYRLNKNVNTEVKTYGVFSVGTSQVKANAETTNNFISSEQDYIAFSPTAGFVFQFKNDLQLIAIIGVDYLSGKVGSEWVYKDKPFLGIGIGFSAFEFGKKEGLKKNNN